MPKRSTEYLSRRRQELAEAAMRCFTDSGYHATSIPDICRQAGVSIGTLYKYFDSKRDMWMASYDFQVSELLARAGEFDWAGLRNELIRGLASLEDSQRLGTLASSLEFTADALRDREYANWAESQVRATREFLVGELQRLHAAGEVALPLGAGTTERMLRSILMGAVTQYLWESSVPVTEFEAEVRQALDYLVGAT